MKFPHKPNYTTRRFRLLNQSHVTNFAGPTIGPMNRQGEPLPPLTTSGNKPCSILKVTDLNCTSSSTTQTSAEYSFANVDRRGKKFGWWIAHNILSYIPHFTVLQKAAIEAAVE